MDLLTSSPSTLLPDRGKNIPIDLCQWKHSGGLSDKVISNYDGPKLTASEQNLGFLQSGDPRSKLVFSLFKDGDGLSLLLNGFGSPNSATKAQIRSISPMAQVRSGTYTTPTFIVHSEWDEVVPYTMVVDFIRELMNGGVNAGLLVVPKARHILI